MFRLQVDVDDFYTRDMAVNLVGSYRESDKGSLFFGSRARIDFPSELSAVASVPFIGCVGDVAYNLQ